MIFLCNGLLFGNKTKLCADTCYNMDEYRKQCYVREVILHYCLYKVFRIANIERKSISVVTKNRGIGAEMWGELGQKCEVTQNEYGVPFMQWWKYSKTDYDGFHNFVSILNPNEVSTLSR